MSLRELLAGERVRACLERIAAAAPDDVVGALSRPVLSFQDYLALLSEAAAPYLERLACRAQEVTRERFGRVIQLYAPLYVSNECTNACVYCGFSRRNEIRRTTLPLPEAEAEAGLLWSMGFRNLLLVSGEAPQAVPLEYFEALARRLRDRFPALSVEIYPLSEDGYKRLADAGVDGLTIYQETYDPRLYERCHPPGPKSDFAWRLEAPGRGASAGMRRVGIGALLGLGSWRYEAAALGIHALWLQREHWRTQVSVSFPRLRQAPGGFAPTVPVSDRELVQLACALRLLLPDAGLTLSTREPPSLRDSMARICITHMSAGSRTQPGGYTRPAEAGAQFSIQDERSPAEVAEALTTLGVEPVWKDWDGLLGPCVPPAPPPVDSQTRPAP